MCWSVRILFLFLLKKKLAAKNSAPYKDARAPFSAPQAGMNACIFCGAAPLPRAKPGLRSLFFLPELRHKTKYTVTCGSYCWSASVKGMARILCHGQSGVQLPSSSSCRSAGSRADSHHMHKDQCVQIAEY